MRLRLFLLSAALALPGCMDRVSAPIGAAGPVLDAAVAAKPVDLANRTTLDERLGIAVTAGYTAASRLGAALVRDGRLDKARFKAADQKGFDAVKALRSAYLAGNAPDYTEALRRAGDARDAIVALLAPQK